MSTATVTGAIVSRHLKIVVLTYAELKLMLEGRVVWKFPEGTMIVTVRESVQHGGMIVLLHNDAFPGVELYREIPTAMETVRYTLDDGKLVIEVKP